MADKRKSTEEQAPRQRCRSLRRRGTEEGAERSRGVGVFSCAETRTKRETHMRAGRQVHRVPGWFSSTTSVRHCLCLVFPLLSRPAHRLSSRSSTGQIVPALGGQANTSTLVSILSVCNCAGRLLCGAIGDWALANFGTPRPVHSISCLHILSSAVRCDARQFAR